MVRVRTLLDILGTLICLVGVAPLYPFLDLPAKVAFPLALVAGTLFDRRRRYPLPPLAATTLSIACVAIYALQISRTTLVEPAVNILVLLLAVRLVTEKSGRNYLQIFVLAIFTLAGSSLLTLSIAFFGYLVLLVVLVTVGLVLISFHAVDPELVLERPQAKKVLAVALLLPAASLLLMLFFFAILPRTEHALWNFLNPASTSSTGFTDQVRPGHFAAIAATEDIAFRVKSEPVGPDQLYWRTIVLNTMDGTTWIRKDPPGNEVLRVTGGGSLPQEFFCEPRQGRYLPTLDLPMQISGLRHRDAGERVFSVYRLSERRVHYQVTSMPGGQLEQRGLINRDFYLRPPVPVSARVAEISRRIAADAPTAAGRIERLQTFFIDQQLSYATSDLPGPTDPVDEFLFEKKRGYCEFFASSFAQLLRLAGVPARLVGGYYGGEYNQLGGYYLVTEDTAHVWVEALLEDGRWLRIDPSRLASNASTTLLDTRPRQLGIARRLADSIDYFWTQAVLTYDFGRQIQIAKGARNSLRGKAPSLTVKPLLVGLATLCIVMLLLKQLRRGGKSRQERILAAYLRQVKKCHGLAALPEGVGLYELARRLNDPLCREFAELYGGAIYRDRRLTDEELRRLRELVRELGRKGPVLDRS
ncbi:transglutaminaseTgpA domain-containing protein [Trichloromonas sp.]|uniref:transglutaminase family protein n=1 Tax=Trichloromonas sp. TaxID=3069249 RepID=UPI003D81AA66